MARAFIHQGVWRVRPAPVVDPHGQKRATLRVSAAAAMGTLALAVLQVGPVAEPASSRRSAVIEKPELVSIKSADRVPSLPEPASPLRRRPAVEAAPEDARLEAARPAAAAPDAPGAAAGVRAAQTVRAADAVEAGMIRAGDRVFRLAGIVTPDLGETCRRLDGLAVSCADRAHSYLQLLVKGRAVVCEPAPQTADGPVEAACRVGEADVAEQLVRQGWARAADKPEERFVQAQAAARKQRLGVWRE
jgi:endonuclease YncB( thermonuclease family)